MNMHSLDFFHHFLQRLCVSFHKCARDVEVTFYGHPPVMGLWDFQSIFALKYL